MSLKVAINNFNRVASNIEIESLLSNEAMNAVTFISTVGAIDTQAFAGSVTKAELSSTLGAGDLVEKIDMSLGQSTAGGTSILPEEFYVSGKILADIPGSPTTQEKDDFLSYLDQVLYDVTVVNERQFTCLVFDDLTDIIGDEDFILDINTKLSSWFSVAFMTVDKITDVTETMRDDCTNIFFIQSYESATDIFEKYSDGALAGRIIYQGVGNTQGVAKELTGITAYKPSFVGGEVGKMSTTEAAAWISAGINIYTRYINNKNETSGVVSPVGEDFTNIWALYKVSSDLSQDLHDLRHNEEVLTVQDEGTVRAAIVDRMAKLKRPVSQGGLGIIYDYKVTSANLDYTLESNQGRFEFNVEVSLFQEGKNFTLNITGYKDLRQFDIEQAA
jgi:hypothetical protein